MQLNNCDFVFDSVLHMGHSGDGFLSASVWFKYENTMGLLFVLNCVRVRRFDLGSVASV